MRITGGSEGGRRLVAPSGHGTRPTSARTREAIFDVLAARWFGHALGGVRALDLYAGAGTLGLEALSRGASACVFVDRAATAARAIQANLRTLGLPREAARVVRGEVLRELERLAAGGERFQLVFVDPPYAGEEATRALEALAASPLVADGAVVVVEHATRRPPALDPATAGLRAVVTRRYGDTSVTFYEVEAA